MTVSTTSSNSVDDSELIPLQNQLTLSENIDETVTQIINKQCISAPFQKQKNPL